MITEPIYSMHKRDNSYVVVYDAFGSVKTFAEGLTKKQAKNIVYLETGLRKCRLVKAINEYRGFGLGVKRDAKIRRIIDARPYELVFDEPEEYEIASWYLSALINDDYSSFDFYYDEEKKRDMAIKRFDRWVKNTMSGRSGHWSYYSEGSENDAEREKAGEHFAFCDVSGKMAGCETVIFYPQRKVFKS